MAVIVATMIFSFWICRAGPFSTGKEMETLNSMRVQTVNNPGATAFGASASENYSSDVTQVLDKLKNSTDSSSQ
jgi:hypothetical protein